MTEPSLLTSVGVKSMNPTGTPSDWMLGAAKARAGPPSLACIHPVRQIASNHFLMGAPPLQVRLDGDRHRQRERKAYHHDQRHLHNYRSVGRRSRNGRQHSKRQAADLLERPPWRNDRPGVPNSRHAEAFIARYNTEWLVVRAG